jgi:glycosyltransferase involved in cell wall biosynthesis
VAIQAQTVGYIVSTWPRLSQTFVLNEIIALERCGMGVRIFSVKDPSSEPVHSKVSKVRAVVSYLALKGRWKPVANAHLDIFRKTPGRYLRTLLQALRYGQFSILRCFLQAGYLADQLSLDPVAHLHAHFATAPTLVAMFASDLIGTPYSFTAHARDIYADTRPEVLRAEMQRARAVVTVSEYNRQYLVNRISPDSNGKISRIDYGVDLSELSFRWPRASDKGTPIILAVARLVEKKGLGDLILAADILRKQGHLFRLEIIGEGALRQELEKRVAELGLQGCVTLLGAQPHEKVRQAYDHASIFALPCVVAADGDRDGLPNVLLEAMASGIPVISTSVVGIPELIESECDGLIVQSNNPPELACALERLLGDSQLRDRLACAARTKIEERFSIDRSAEQLVRLFVPVETAREQC